MEKIIFRCKTCKVALTEPLSQLDDESKLGKRDQDPYVPTGFFYPALPFYSHSASIGFEQSVINLEDVRNTESHPESRRSAGCCGPCAMYGRNIVCLNGHEVGTEQSDCYLIHGLAFDPDCVEMMKVETEEKAQNV